MYPICNDDKIRRGHFENEWTSIATKSPLPKPPFTLSYVFGVFVFALGVNVKL
jgi:hypothetical protein